MEVSTRVYQESAAESQKASENGSSSDEDTGDKKDNVKDAEFEEK